MDDDQLNDLDLDAWSPPALPADFADRVVARHVQVDQVIAVELGRRSKRRWLFGTGLAAVLAIAAAIVVWLMPGAQPDVDGGNVVATKPVHLPFGDLERGAVVVWHRDGADIRVVQTAGAATWHVGANQHLSVEATLASISATDATLHVESKMHLSDVKVIGTTAIVAAALVTVVVYEGHANVAGGGQNVVVNPGNTVTIHIGSDDVPRLPKQVVMKHRITADKPAEVTIDASDSVTIHDPTGAVSVAIEPNCDDDQFEKTFPLDVKIEHDKYGNPILPVGAFPYAIKCKTGNPKTGVITIVADDGAQFGQIVMKPDAWQPEMEVNGTFAINGSRVTVDDTTLMITPGVDGGTFNRGNLHLAVPGVLAVRIDTPSDGSHVLVRRAPVSHPLKQLDATDIHMVMATAKPLFVRCAIHSKVNLAFTIHPDGTVDNVTATSKDKPAASCAKDVVSGMRFQKAQQGVSTTFALDPPCDPSLVEQATQAEGRGSHAQAVALLTEAYSCKPDSHTLALAFMASCNAENPKVAAAFWKKMSPDQQGHYLQLCLHNHITKDQLDQ